MLISLIIPFFNREDFLEEAIKSVLSQSDNDWELILVDDGSTDKSTGIARGYSSQYANIHYLEHEEHQNLGTSASRNLGIAHAKGTFISFLDSDDVFLPETLALKREAFNQNPAVDAVCGTLLYWTTWRREKPSFFLYDFVVKLGLETNTTYAPPTLLVHNLVAGGRKPGINCIMLKRTFLEEIGGFESDFRHISEDQVFWAKVSLNGTIFVMDACLAKYRQHENSGCAQSIRKGTEVAEWEAYIQWLEKYVAAQGFDSPEVLKAMTVCKKRLHFQYRFRSIKQFYRKVLPLHLRFRIRDALIKMHTKR